MKNIENRQIPVHTKKNEKHAKIKENWDKFCRLLEVNSIT